MNIFTSVQEAFNYWNQRTVEEIEKRAGEIKNILTTDANANVSALNIEIQGLQEAKKNLLEKKQSVDLRGLNPITGAVMGTAQKKETLDGSICETAEYRSAFFKTMLSRDLTDVETAALNKGREELRASGFNALSDNAAVVPSSTLNEIIRKAKDQGGLMSICRGFNMPSNIAIPIGTPVTAAAWHTEGAPVEAEKVETTSVTFSAYEIIKILSLSVAARTMSITAFESYLTDELSSCILETLGKALVNGAGTSQGTGILKAVGMTEIEYTDAPTYQDIVKTVASLKRGYANGASWVMNTADLYNLFYALVDGNGRPLFIPYTESAQTISIGRLLGMPVVLDDYMPAGEILLGNFRYMAYNLPKGITIEKSEQSSFRSALVDYRAIAVADCKCILPEAFVHLKKHSEAA